jgi:hypothetical protein
LYHYDPLEKTFFIFGRKKALTINEEKRKAYPLFLGNNFGGGHDQRLPSHPPKAASDQYSIVPPFCKFLGQIDAPISKIQLHKFSKKSSRGTILQQKVKPRSK